MRTTMTDHQILDEAVGLTDSEWDRRMAEALRPMPLACRACNGRALGPDALPCRPCKGSGMEVSR
jgi:hypothetical protein